MVTIQEWLSGVTRLPNKVSLKGNIPSAFNRSAPASTSSVAATPSTLSVQSPSPLASSPAMQPKFGGASKPSSTAPIFGVNKPATPAASTPAFKPSVSAAPAAPEPPKGEAALIKAWYAQQKEIEDLKKKIAQLEGQ